jgi:hypothetical protein
MLLLTPESQRTVALRDGQPEPEDHARARTATTGRSGALDERRPNESPKMGVLLFTAATAAIAGAKQTEGRECPDEDGHRLSLTLSLTE